MSRAAVVLGLRAGVARVRPLGRRLTRSGSESSPAEPIFRHPHLTALGVLLALDLLVLRRIVFSTAAPAGVDSAFLYSELSLFERHGLHAFTAWLPEPFGQVQQYSIYWLLAAVDGIVGSPLLVYKAALVLTVLVASAGVYGLVFWLSRSSLGAGVSAALYSLAPFAVAQWLAGHLNVGISYAFGPLAIWALWAALRDGSRAAMVALGLIGSVLYLLTTGQGVYWLLALGALALWEVLGAKQRRERAIRLAATVGVAIATFVPVSAVQLMPLLAGLRAPFTDAGARFYIQGLDVHAKYSEPLLQSVLGVPREDWTSPEVSIAGAPFDTVPFKLLALTLVLIALASLLTRARRTALILAGPTIGAWLLACGPDGPAGPLYRQLYYHLPFFSLLRVPNRWLMISVLGVSVMAGLAISQLSAVPAPGRPRWQSPKICTGAYVAYLAAFMGFYALSSGLPTWRAPAPFASAYAPLKGDFDDGRVLTTPFWQAWMPSRSSFHPDLSIAADLGFTSMRWHGHPVVQRGGWDPRASRFVSYLYDLTRQGTTTSLPKLLGAVGVEYVGINPEATLEVVGGQNRFFRRQRGLRLLRREGQVSVYHNRYVLPAAYVVPRWCLAAGGMHILGDLAEAGSFDFRRTGLLFADQIARLRGRGGLRSELRSSRCLILAPEGRDQMAVLLGASDFRDLASVAPRSWSGAETRPMLDMGAEPSVAVDVPPRSTLKAVVAAPTDGRYSVWVAGLRAADKEPLAMRVDGGRIRRLPMASAGSGMRWHKTPARFLKKGEHSVELTNTANGEGAALQLTRLALMTPGAAGWSPTRLRGVRVVQEAGGVGPLRAGLSAPVLPLSLGRWTSEGAQRGVDVIPATAGARLRVSGSRRQYFALARAKVHGAIDPRRPIGIDFGGSGSGQTFFLRVLFDEKGGKTATFRFVDDTRKTRRVVFSPQQPTSSSVVPDWSSVRYVSLATSSKAPLPAPIVVRGPYQLAGVSLAARFRAQGGGSTFPAAGRARSALADPPRSIGDRVDLRQGLGTGLLVFTQSFHAAWQTSPSGSAGSHSVALGFANAVRLTRSSAPERLVFAKAGYGRVGMWLSLLAWTVALIVLLVSLRREHRDGRASWSGHAG